ncbi:MAG: 2-C-methyl-D-erythritol 4-phosphate cytidylyltransferase [Alteromonadaceae bacterium]|nr:MAG: 2-C-methyl-D-erythritol 4-phosphate cytidylyltransferase [Alteromonadaceae bacterium]
MSISHFAPSSIDISTLADIWAIVPASGIGSRMQSEQPKQYLPLQNKRLIDITLGKLLALKYVKGVVLALAKEDNYWKQGELYQHPRIHIVDGGKERSDSVFNALHYTKTHLVCDTPVWALVHDAARPCVSEDRIHALVSHCLDSQHGGILAVPASDTIKRVSNKVKIQHTEDRNTLWLAHTPQLFPLDALYQALHYCEQNNIPVTDEASALEHVGETVSVITDRPDNIKVTVPEHLAWAEFILSTQKKS